MLPRSVDGVGLGAALQAQVRDVTTTQAQVGDMQECGQAGDFKAGSFALLVSYGLAKCAFLVVPIGFQGGVSFVNKDKSGARLSEGKKSAIQGIHLGP